MKQQPSEFTEAQNPEAKSEILYPKKFGYDRLFPAATAYSFTFEDLKLLAKFMTVRRDEIPDSKILAGYTYLGQFIDHDISRMIIVVSTDDPVDVPFMLNERSSFFDLESIYGKGPVLSNELYSSDTLLKLGTTIGDGLGGATGKFPNDLPRRTGNSLAFLVDDRNDENLPIAQTHVAFIKFHNAVVKSLGDDGSLALFERAREIVIKHFQWVVVHDYLPKIIKDSVLDDVLVGGAKYYHPTVENPYMPVEFAGAAFRFGHSMVRDFYQWNDIFRDKSLGGIIKSASLSDLTDFTGSQGLKTFGTRVNKENLPSAWMIDWHRFYDFTGSASSIDRQFNFAREIDTAIAPQLGKLRQSAGGGSLPERNLSRGWTLRLPTGQSVAQRIRQDFPQTEILTETEIRQMLPGEPTPNFSAELIQKFSVETPLWYYILAEAQIKESGNKLGDVGSRIVAETIGGLIKISPISYMKESGWKPYMGQDSSEKFGMTDLLRIAGF
jgi:hypothetical protein